MKTITKRNPSRLGCKAGVSLLAGRKASASLRARGFDLLPEPVFLIGARGEILDANREGQALLERLPASGANGALGREELCELFLSSIPKEPATAPLRVESEDGLRYYDVLIGPGSRDSLRTVILADVTAWKRALAEKEAMINSVRADGETPVTVCARCGSLKSRSGQWQKPEAAALLAIPRDRLSHGLCPTCFVKELAMLGLGSQDKNQETLRRRT